MHMIWHSIYNNGFLLFTLNDARNIFMQFSIPTLADHVFSSLYGKNYLYVDLRKCSWHGDLFGLVRCHPFGVYCPNLHLYYNHISPSGFLHDAAKYEFDNVNPSGSIVSNLHLYYNHISSSGFFDDNSNMNFGLLWFHFTGCSLPNNKRLSLADRGSFSLVNPICPY